MTLTPDDLIGDPSLLTRALRAGDGTPFTARLLRPEDADGLGAYLAGLSAATRRVFSPHPLTAEHAVVLCDAIDYRRQLTFLAIVDADGSETVVGYFMLRLGLGDSEGRRYIDHGAPLPHEATASLAPSVADEYQDRGMGSAMIPHLLDTARRLGFRHLILGGGVRGDNPRARHFYEKSGFRHVGDFIAAEIVNHDMILDL